MTSVFIVRPFGKKPVVLRKDDKDETVEVDFEEIDRTLIQPALVRNGLRGDTTGVIAEAGNIRVDMFQMLIAYDLVIADISIDNANAFYELGVRHGLRPKGTILIRFSTGKEVPFDLRTDRYIDYNRDKPEEAVERLAKSIEQTRRAMAATDQKPDSPVFLLLPELKAPNPAKLIVVPREFQDAVELAEKGDKNGATTLALLAEEAKLADWSTEGLRLVGRAQRRMKNFKVARETWEAVLKARPNDVDARLQLATIYQRLDELVLASQACRHVLENPDADRKQRADARSQLARNEKWLWAAAFKAVPTEQARRRQAVKDGRLVKAFEGYMEGFSEDLNDYYSGINALALLSAIVGLADLEQAAWSGLFRTPKKATEELDDYRDQLQQICGAVRMSLENARRISERTETPDEWLEASEAQFELLTSENFEYVGNRYRAARNGPQFSVESETAQVAIFHCLGLSVNNCRAALEALDVSPDAMEALCGPQAAQQAADPRRNRILVVTGHRADAPDRKEPRFPSTPAAIDRARAWLREKITAEKAATTGTISGIGGAASGTDLLFHEVCAELGIPTMIVLPIPVDAYRRRSVADSGPEWVERFQKLVAAKPPLVLSQSEDLPVWTASKNYGVFQRGNIWVMEHALLQPNADVTLLALWNEKPGEGPGGTSDMVKLADSHGAKVEKENTNKLFGL